MTPPSSQPAASMGSFSRSHTRVVSLNALALFAALGAPGVTAFSAPSMLPAQRRDLGFSFGRTCARAAGLKVSMALRDKNDHRDRESEHMKRMIKDFVTQRAVQSYLFTLEQVGDRNDHEWIEGYEGHQGLSNVHAYNALRCSWKEYLNGMLRLPEEIVTKKSEYYRGGSKDNPYIQPSVMEFTVTLSPRKYVNTIMDLREQVSREWVGDLELIARENAEHWRHHLAMVTNGTDPEIGLQHRLIQPSDTDSSLRLDNYDLLEKFCTHVACTQVQMELASKTADEHQAMWLKQFMEDKSSFSSTDTRGAGRTFLAHLLDEPPRISSSWRTPGDSDIEESEVKLIDPLDIAARIMAQRQVVAERWIEALEETEEDQLNIHREFMTSCLTSFAASLEKLMD
eukprot:CAMPEP_0173103212 /NCGR_PEP_ID=MMETSP1102-20130122/38187_1 /TAXON_ID=49646 /ORGANISM="Geminigera sp., Strain Caron Lab Isolate" /LENGTH=397 /DNA_ID=CAMNT_0013997847 /DNA_START=121 /DNA_END=1314 /DNA_ORIENTATION=-